MKTEANPDRTLTFIFNSVSLFLTALRAYQRSINDIPPYDNSLISIIFAAASIEAAVNELVDALSSLLKSGTYSNPTVRWFVDLQFELEESRGSVKSKVLMAKWTLSGKAFDKSSLLYQDFVALMDLRNELVHMKGMSSDTPFGQRAKFREPKACAHLRSRHLLKPLADHEVAGWASDIRNEKCAFWACDTAAHIVFELSSSLPSDNDSLVHFQKLFEDDFIKNPLLKARN